MALSDNLEAYYKFDESSGNAADATGNGYTATNTSVTYSTGKINNGADFNGSSSKFSHTLNLGGDFSISVWFYGDSFASYPYIYNDWGGSDNKNIFFIMYDGGDLKFNRGNGGASEGTALSVSGFSTSTWYHVVITQAGTAQKMYVNAGAPSTATATYTGGATAETPYIGSQATGGGDIWDGIIDEMGFWSRAITSTEVSDLYNGGAGLAYPFGSSSEIKTINGLAVASVKTVNGLSTASVKTVNGLA